MAKITKVTNDMEYDAALERLDEIFHAEGGALGEELNELAKLIEAYEDELYPEFRNPMDCKQRYPEDD